MVSIPYPPAKARMTTQELERTLERRTRQVAALSRIALALAGPLDPETEELLQGLGGQIGTAIDRSRAYEREGALRHRLEALNDATLAIAAELSLPVLLQRITDIAAELTGARYAALGVADEQRR